MLLWQLRSLPHLVLKECRQPWPVLLLVDTVPKQAVEVGAGSRRVFSFRRIATANCARRDAPVGACGEQRGPNVRAIVLAGAALARDQNDEFWIHWRRWEWTGISQHIARIQVPFETGQARPVGPKSHGRQRGVSGVRPEVSAVSSAAHGQRVPGDAVYPSHGSSSDLGSVLVAGPDSSHHGNKVPVPTAKSSGVGCHGSDRSAALQQMEIAERRGTSLDSRHQYVSDVHCSNVV